jgi:GH25 family lysozyme M1 (1,4-beta-N-acetylmuramidase)
MKILKLKAIIILSTIIVVSGVAMAVYATLNNSNKKAQETNTEVAETYEMEVVETPEGTIEAEENSEGTVTFDGKEIKLKKAVVSTKEDGQKQKTGGEKTSVDQALHEYVGNFIGIDVSYYQGNINWAQVKASGIEFAIIRAGYRGYGTGVMCEDPQFKNNMANAIKNGVKVGVYFYSAAINEQEALEEAAWVVDAIKTYSVTYPVVYDFEEFQRNRCASVDGNVATKNALAFLGYVSSHGYTGMMYANKNDITTRLNRSAFSSYKFWLAHYTKQTDYKGSYHMWQYTSQGSVPGIVRKCRYECFIFWI